MDSPPSHSSSLEPKSGKVPVVRGARACSVCRLAKMKCVGAEDGATQCQRCKRTGQECVFEKHKRGRKPGSKLSEASKMLRKLEKGLHNAKAKSHAGTTLPSPESRVGGSSHPEFDPREPFDPKPLDGHQPRFGESFPTTAPSSRDEEEDEEDKDIYPSKLIRNETHRNSFFSTILNPQHENPTTQLRSTSLPSPPSGITDTTVDDVITLGILSQSEANKFFDLVFLRLNPYINLFDPALHTATHVRSKSRFLFTTLMMAVCRFFEPKRHKQCQELANEMATKAFTYGWKSVEVAQAFACLTYYKEPDDTRTWTFIGYACRMAVELGLNRYHALPPERESPFQRLERRNRERTYLVLFVHDRSLSTQTGRSWMLPECELVRNSVTWHERGGMDTIRPEDVILCSLVELRRIAAETTDVFATPQAGSSSNHGDLNFDLVLGNCNNKLSQWTQHWEREMHRANADKFQFALINSFRLYIRLFLNSFGLQGALSLATTGRVSPSLQTLSACYQSALDLLKILFTDFARMSMLCYSQDSITIMSAYASIFLLRLLKSPIALYDGAAREFHDHISRTADAYEEASSISPTASSAQFHSRFLRTLISNDQDRRREGTAETRSPDSGTLSFPSYSPPFNQATMVLGQETSISPIPYAPIPPQHPNYINPNRVTRQGYGSSISAIPINASAPDQQYWRNMFGELGYDQPMMNNGAMVGYGESQRYQMQRMYTSGF